MRDFYHLDPVCSRNKYTLEGIGKPCRQSLSWLNEKERTLQKSCSVFIENTQAVAWDSLKPRPSLDRTPKRHIGFRTEGSILTFALSKI